MQPNEAHSLFGQNMLCALTSTCLFTIRLALETCPSWSRLLCASCLAHVFCSMWQTITALTASRTQAKQSRIHRGDEVCAVRVQAALPKAEVRRSTRAASRAASQHHSHSQQHAPTVSQPPSPGTPPEPLLTAHQDPHLTNADPTQPTAQQAQHAQGAFETGADHAVPADGSDMQLEAMQGDNDNGDAMPVGTAEQADTEQALQQSQIHTQLTSQEAQEAGLQEGGEAQLALALQPSQEQGERTF